MLNFWLKFDNEKKEQLGEIKSGIRKEQVDKKFHNIFDAYDANCNDTLEKNEVDAITNWLRAAANSMVADSTLDTNENNHLTSIFAQQYGIEDVDFQGFVKAIYDAGGDIIESEESQTSDGGKQIKTKYEGGITETIEYYPNGDFKWKKIEKQFSETLYVINVNGQIQEATEEQFNEVLAEVEKMQKKPQTQKVVRGIEDVISIATPFVSASIVTNEWKEEEEQFSPRFVAETLGLDVNTEDGKKILERLSFFPKEVLAQIKGNAQEIKHLISSNELELTFDNLSNVLEIVYGITLRDEEELEAAKPQRELLITQIRAVEVLTNLFETVAQWNDQYTDSLGLFGLGSEGIGYLLNKLGLDGENHYQWAETCREYAANVSKLLVLNPEKFAKDFKNFMGDYAEEYGIEFDEKAFKKMFDLIDSGKATTEDGKLTKDYQDAILKAVNFVASDPNDSILNMVGNAIGETILLVGTFVYAAGAECVEAASSATIGTFSRAGVALASKQVNSKLLQGALRFSGNTIKLIGPALVEGTKMAAYTVAEGTLTNAGNRVIKFDSEEDTIGKFLETEGMVLDNSKGSFVFGAFAGVYGSTVTQRVMQSASKISTKVGTALAEKFSKGAVDANEVFATILEKSAPTKIAEAAAFATDVIGFTLFESAMTLATKMEGFPDDITFEDITNLLWEEFKGQGYNLGQIKGVSYLIITLSGSRNARMMATRSMKENNPQLKGITIESIGEVFRIKFADGKTVECKNIAEMISATSLLARGEAPLGKIFAEIKEPNAIAEQPAERANIPTVETPLSEESQARDAIKSQVEKTPAMDMGSENKSLYDITLEDEPLILDLENPELVLDLDGASVYNFKNLPESDLQEYSYNLQNGKIVRKFKAPKGLNHKQLLNYARLDDLKIKFANSNEYFRGYNETTQNRIAKIAIERNLDRNTLNRLITGIKNEQRLLDIINNPKLLEEYLSNVDTLSAYITRPGAVTHFGNLLDLMHADPAKFQEIANSSLFDLVNKNKLEMKVIGYKYETQNVIIKLLDVDNINCDGLNKIFQGMVEESHVYDIISDNNVLKKYLDSVEYFSGIFDKPNSFYFLGGMLDIKSSNMPHCQKIMDSGIIDLITDGKLDIRVLSRIGLHADLSPEIYSDLAALRTGKSIVPEFPAGTDINVAFKSTSIGDAVEIGNKMYLNDGHQLIEWNMTKEKYLELFPPVQRFAPVQGSVGNCHLVQTLGHSMHNPLARVDFLQSFSLKGNDVVVTIKGLEDYNGSYSFKDGVINLSNSSKNLIGCKGMQMYEQAYARVALRENNSVQYPNIAPVDYIVERTESGQAAQTMADVFGKGHVADLISVEGRSIGSYKRASSNTVPYLQNGKQVAVNLNCQNPATKTYVFDRYFKDFPDKTLAINKLDFSTTEILLSHAANNQEFLVSFGTIKVPSGAIESNLLAEYNLVSQHAYSILGYDVSTGIVKIGNPHSYAAATEIPLSILHKYIGHIDFLKL